MILDFASTCRNVELLGGSALGWLLSQRESSLLTKNSLANVSFDNVVVKFLLFDVALPSQVVVKETLRGHWEGKSYGMSRSTSDSYGKS